MIINNSYLNKEIVSVVKDSQLSLIEDYRTWRSPYIKDRISTDVVDYFIAQIKKTFSQINIIDNSYDKGNHQSVITSYFKNKLKKELEKFHNYHSYQFIDLFCGAGGLSIGLEKAGLLPNLALDKDKSSLLTYHFNRPFLKHHQIINDDIQKVAKGFTFKKTPLVVGGPPCQGFSNANKQKKEGDERNQLYKFFVHTVLTAEPDIFLLENVGGILKSIKQITKDFDEINYTLFPRLLNTKDFGFPQNRKRAFIFGVSNKYKKILFELNSIFESNITSYKKQESFSLWDAISDLPKLNAKTLRNATYKESLEWGYTFGQMKKNTTSYSNLINSDHNLRCPILNHKSKYNNDRDIKIYGLLKPGEKSDAESIASINPYLNRKDIFKDKFFKLQPDKPSKTITAHMYYDCHMYIHPYSARGLTPREAARLQGFPDDYYFLGSPNEWYRQIGNAVSPVLANILGEALKKVLDRIYEY